MRKKYFLAMMWLIGTGIIPVQFAFIDNAHASYVLPHEPTKGKCTIKLSVDANGNPIGPATITLPDGTTETIVDDNDPDQFNVRNDACGNPHCTSTTILTNGQPDPLTPQPCSPLPSPSPEPSPAPPGPPDDGGTHG